MSRKDRQVAKSSLAMGGSNSTIDFATPGAHTKLEAAPNWKKAHSVSKTSRRPQAGCNGDNEGSSSDAVAADESEGSQSDSADADSEEATDGDPDVQAPSDAYISAEEGQTGLYQNPQSPSQHVCEAHSKPNFDSDYEKSSNEPHSLAAPASLCKEAILSDDDDDYDGVDLISESGDEEPAVEQLEERAIVDSEEDNIAHSRRLSSHNSPPDSFSFSPTDFGNTDLGISPWLTEDPFFADQINLLDRDDSTYSAAYYGSAQCHDPPIEVEDATRRRVRFAEPLMLSSAAETLHFRIPNDAASPAVDQRTNESKNNEVHRAEADQSSLNGGSVTGGEAVNISSSQGDALPLEDYDPPKDDDAASLAGSSSGYETDQGETTDEEDVPASATTRPSALLRSSSSDLNNRLAAQPLPKAPTSKLPPGHRWGPTLGSWVADRTKPIAVVASSGTQLIVYPAQRPSSSEGKVFPTIASSSKSSAQVSPRTPLSRIAAPSYPTPTDESEMERSDMSSQDVATPMLSASPNLMMSGLGLGSANLLSGHALGPPEAFYPFQSIGTDGKIILDTTDVDDDDDDDDDGEGILNIEDFIDFGEDSEDNDGEDGSNTESLQSPMIGHSNLTDADPTPTVSPITPTSGHKFFDRLDKGVVTAFRRNQYDREPNGYRSSNASSSRIPNAIKSNAFVAASSLGALKKRKLSSDFGPLSMASHAFEKRRMVNPH
ncbi:MAG: hypothetical protein Q9170_000186 [Blastenia crenularia]